MTIPRRTFLTACAALLGLQAPESSRMVIYYRVDESGKMAPSEFAYGGASELWGSDAWFLTVAQVNAQSFGVAVG